MIGLVFWAHMAITNVRGTCWTLGFYPPKFSKGCAEMMVQGPVRCSLDGKPLPDCSYTPTDSRWHHLVIEMDRVDLYQTIIRNLEKQ